MLTANPPAVSQNVSGISPAGAVKTGQTANTHRRRASGPRRRREELAPLIVRDVQQLRALGELKAFRSRQALVLELPELSSTAAFAVAERLNALRRECGCSLGAKFMVVSFVLSAAWLLKTYGFGVAVFWRAPIAVLAAIFFAAIGKLIGLALARRNFHREVKLLVMQMTEKKRKE